MCCRERSFCATENDGYPFHCTSTGHLQRFDVPMNSGHHFGPIKSKSGSRQLNAMAVTVEGTGTAVFFSDVVTIVVSLMFGRCDRNYRCTA